MELWEMILLGILAIVAAWLIKPLIVERRAISEAAEISLGVIVIVMLWLARPLLEKLLVLPFY